MADYRVYGSSTGAPSFPTMLADAHLILAAFESFLAEHGLPGRRFVMGRSMGGHSAVELAAHHPGTLSGLVLESSAPNISRLLEHLEGVGNQAEAAELQRCHNAKVQAIALPTLAIHGERDDLIPIGRVVEFFDLLTTPNKHLEGIPHAGHNDILWMGTEQYLQAVRAFIQA